MPLTAAILAPSDQRLSDERGAAPAAGRTARRELPGRPARHARDSQGRA